MPSPRKKRPSSTGRTGDRTNANRAIHDVERGAITNNEVRVVTESCHITRSVHQSALVVNAGDGSHGGGHVPVDPNDSKGLKTLERVFYVDLSLPAEAIPGGVQLTIDATLEREHRDKPACVAQAIYRFYDPS